MSWVFSPQPAKQADRRINEQHISKHLVNEKILNDNQGGLRRGFPTTKVISNLANDILRDMNEGEQSTATFIYFSKEFNTIHNAINKEAKTTRNKRRNVRLD